MILNLLLKYKCNCISSLKKGLLCVLIEQNETDNVLFRQVLYFYTMMVLPILSQIQDSNLLYSNPLNIEYIILKMHKALLSSSATRLDFKNYFELR